MPRAGHLMRTLNGPPPTYRTWPTPGIESLLRRVLGCWTSSQRVGPAFCANAMRPQPNSAAATLTLSATKLGARSSFLRKLNGEVRAAGPQAIELAERLVRREADAVLRALRPGDGERCIARDLM